MLSPNDRNHIWCSPWRSRWFCEESSFGAWCHTKHTYTKLADCMTSAPGCLSRDSDHGQQWIKQGVPHANRATCIGSGTDISNMPPKPDSRHGPAGERIRMCQNPCIPRKSCSSHRRGRSGDASERPDAPASTPRCRPSSRFVRLMDGPEGEARTSVPRAAGFGVCVRNRSRVCACPGGRITGRAPGPRASRGTRTPDSFTRLSRPAITASNRDPHETSSGALP